jgi:TPP-dependent 2-oxoacid decarboxylase
VNGIAGSYAEKIPVIHVVGAPKTTLARRGAMMHHSLGDGDYDVFYNMYSRITTASAILTATSAVYDIDRVISESMKNRCPGKDRAGFENRSCKVNVQHA